MSGDENLNFDFHDYNDKVVVTSGTGVNALDFGSMNLSTTGVLTLGGSTTGTLVTRVSSGAPTQSDTNGSLVVDDTGGRLYFRYGNSWHWKETGGEISSVCLSSSKLIVQFCLWQYRMLHLHHCPHLPARQARCR